MSLVDAIYAVVIQPIALALEFVFSVAYNLSDNPGISVLALSLAVSLLALPLYKRADALQAEEMMRVEKMQKWVKHINKTFRGDERFMVLKTFYRQNNYKPFYALKGSLSLVLQIPFFIAAYQFLSKVPVLKGASFLCISDLGVQDGIIRLDTLSINLLPILMTAVNIYSAFIYTKGQSKKHMIQPVLLALLFLVLLYKSPAGLVLYWLLNNIFSLVKNIILVPKREKVNTKEQKKEIESQSGIFWMSAIMLTILAGFLIPSSVIKASPGEFVSIYGMQNPLHYVFQAMLVAMGFFVLWMGCYYVLSTNKAKRVFEQCFFCISVLAVIDYFCVGTNLGLIESNLKYKIVHYDITEILVNSVEMVAVVFLCILALPKLKQKATYIVGAVCVSFFVIGMVNSFFINSDYKVMSVQGTKTSYEPQFCLSRSNKNVVVIMLDKAINPLVPYIFEEKPELYEQFDGFTYYSNTISHGVGTKTASPSVFGGYEYTPDKLNERKDETMESKHNEALRVMPVLFAEHGFDVFVYDPPYAGYQQIPDLSIYEDYSDINAYITLGKYSPYGDALETRMEEVRSRNFFCYSLFKMSPVFLQTFLYDDGNYHEVGTEYTLGEVYGEGVLAEQMTVNHTTEGLSKASGLNKAFTDSYYALGGMTEYTTVEDGDKGAFWMLYNSTPHDPCYLQKPEYMPELYVDNTLYDTDLHYEIDGRVMHLDNETQVSHYHVNMAAYLQLGKWFDRLRELGVYDNTRIILVADHGCNIDFFDDTYVDNASMEYVAPLLMVKDFNATGFNISDEFMTNADVPTLATEGLIIDPKNPFSGNVIDDSDKQSPQLVTYSIDLDAGKENGGNTILPGQWYTVHDDMWNPDNWEYKGTY